MRRNEALDFVTSELSSRGIRFDTATSGSNHIEIRWQVSPDKEVRSFFAPNTPSDHRGRLNARAAVRRLLKADGVNLEPPASRKPAALLHRALELPKHVDPVPDQLKALRGELADLTELMLDLSGTVTMIREHILHREPKPAPPPKPPSARSVKIMDYIVANWSSLDALARDTGLTEAAIWRKLHYLKTKKGAHIDLERHRVRIHPTKPHLVNRK
jgi:biotin operon repressor